MAQEIRSPFQSRDENSDEVRSLGDLIDARENPSQDDAAVREIQGDDDNLDIEDALTYPHRKRRRAREVPDPSDFDADARTSSPPDDPDDASYMTRADFVDSMGLTDPDPNEGANDPDYIGDAGINRAPDITGTVMGINRGMATHLPQDIGAGGFQIEEPDSVDDPRVIDAASDEDLLNEEDTDLLEEEDGDRIPTRRPDIDTRDEALDATRRIR